MLISIITATYNSEKTIADTLQSVAKQTYQPVEHLIIDGVSSDDTLQIVKKYPHVALVNSQNDKGIYDAMNRGIALAKGDIIGILNSDDFYLDEKVLEDVAACFKEDKHLMSVYGDLQYVDEENTNLITRKWRAGEYAKQKFKYGWMPPHPTFFVRKEAYEKFGAFNLSLKSSADYELMLRFLYKNNLTTKYIAKTLVSMRTGGQSNASLQNRLKANKEDRLAWEINNLQPYLFTTLLKPARKLFQFTKKKA